MTAELSLVVRRTIRAPRERVFEAWTQPDYLRRWWGPGEVRCDHPDVDLRPGGSYRLENRFPDGSVIWIVGAFEIVEPPERLVYTWRLDPGPPGEQRVTVRFEGRHGGTEVVIVHEKIPTEASRDSHEAGWVGCLDRLVPLLEA